MNRYTHSFFITFLLYAVFLFVALYMLRDVQTKQVTNEVVVKMIILEPQESQNEIQNIKAPKEEQHKPLEKIEQPKALEKQEKPLEQKKESQQDTEALKSAETRNTSQKHSEMPTTKTKQEPEIQKEIIDNVAIKNRFISELKEKIRRNKSYPMAARRRGQEGTINVSFCVHKDGSVSNIVCNGSHDVLRNASEDAVRKSFPFRIPDGAMSSSSMDVTLALNYKLDVEQD